MPTLIHGGRKRTYEQYAPKAVRRHYPLVVSLHGGGGNAAAHRAQTQLDLAADKFGFIAVCPEGTAAIGKAYTWNAGLCCGYAVEKTIDDVGFIRAVIRRVKSQYPIGPVYVCGMSNGAMMTYRVAAELSKEIAGICAVAAGMGVTPAHPPSPVPVMHVHGAKDRNAPFFGGVGDKAFAKIEHRPIWDTIYQWCEWNGCSKQPAKVVNASDHTRIDYAGAKPIRLYVLPDGGHHWHGGRDPTPNFDDGKLVETFDTNARMWEFWEGSRG